MKEPNETQAEAQTGADVGGSALLADWSRISKEARNTMATLGDFRPTFNGEVKGYPQEKGKTYWSSDDLRKMSAHLTEVAEWLDVRAAKSANRGIDPKKVGTVEY